MTLSDVRAAYEDIFQDSTKLGLFLEAIQGTIFNTLFIIFIISLSICAMTINSRCEGDGINDKQCGVDWICFLTAITTTVLFVIIELVSPLINPFSSHAGNEFSTKGDFVILHRDYERYVKEYVNPYLITLPEKRYENLQIEHVENPATFLVEEVYLTYTDIHLINKDNHCELLEKKMKFDAHDLEFVLIRGDESSYVSERVLNDYLGGEFKIGYKKQIAYINETDRKAIEEYLGYEIDFGEG